MGPGSVTALVDARESRVAMVSDTALFVIVRDMNIGSIGKTLASQAIDSAKNSVLDAVKGPAPAAKVAEPAKPAVATADTGAAIIGQIQAMQRSLKEDQELAVQVRAGDEMLRVTEIFVPNPEVLVFAGADREKNVTRVISPVNTAQIVCRIIRVAPGTAPLRVNVLTPKPQPKPGS